MAYYVGYAQLFSSINETFSPFVGQQIIANYPNKIFLLLVVNVIGSGYNPANFKFGITYLNGTGPDPIQN